MNRLLLFTPFIAIIIAILALIIIVAIPFAFLILFLNLICNGGKFKFFDEKIELPVQQKNRFQKIKIPKFDI